MENKYSINLVSNYIGKNNFFIRGLIPTESLSQFLYAKDKKSLYKEKIRSKSKPKLLINHDYSKELKCKKLSIYEDKQGLKFEAVVEYDEELAENYSEIKSLSFGFVIGIDSWSKDGYNLIRTVHSFEELKEISILIGRKPAYEETRVTVLPIKKECNEIDEIVEVKVLVRKNEVAAIRKEIEKLKVG